MGAVNSPPLLIIKTIDGVAVQQNGWVRVPSIHSSLNSNSLLKNRVLNSIALDNNYCNATVSVESQHSTSHLRDGTSEMLNKNELTIDLHDKFFFDHEYDHLPGLLIFDAAWKSVMKAWPDKYETQMPLTSLKLSFESWSDIESPTELRMNEAEQTRSGYRFSGVVKQYRDQAWCSRARFTAEREVLETPCNVASSEASLLNYPFSTNPLAPAAAHKRHPENVLVSEIFREGKTWCCRPIKQPDHVVFKNRTTYSPTHLVEMARQLFNGMADLIADQTPDRDRHFIMTAVKLAFLRQIGFGEPLSLELHTGKVRRIDNLEIARERIEYKVDDQLCATVVIVGYAVDEGDYRQHRGLHTGMKQH